MRHKNKVKQLGRTYSHRKAMFNNMITSLIMEERIVTTKQKGKELKRMSEKLITRAKNNLVLSDSEAGKKLHNKREVMKVIKDRDAVAKLFDTIAPRFKDRNGGYLRIYLLGKRREGDAAEMAIVEFVVKEKAEKKAKTDKDEKGKAKEEKAKGKDDKAKAKEEKAKAKKEKPAKKADEDKTAKAKEKKKEK
jgi:large subunit ribosomal protein L17